MTPELARIDLARWEQIKREAARRRLDDERPVSAAEAARALGVRPGTVRSWASRGLLHSMGDDRSGRALYRLGNVRRLRDDRAQQHTNGGRADG